MPDLEKHGRGVPEAAAAADAIREGDFEHDHVRRTDDAALVSKLRPTSICIRCSKPVADPEHDLERGGHRPMLPVKDEGLAKAVSYLRGLAESEQFNVAVGRMDKVLLMAANDIERGEHLKGAMENSVPQHPACRAVKAGEQCLGLNDHAARHSFEGEPDSWDGPVRWRRAGLRA